MTINNKEMLVEKFKAYLDHMEGEEGLLQSDEIDLFTLFKELAALKSEIKLESRQFKTALDNFKDVFSTLQKSHDALSEVLSLQQENQIARQEESMKPLLLELIAFSDCLNDANSSLRQISVKKYFFSSRKLMKQLISINEGNTMLARRLEGMLATQGIVQIQLLGKPLNPQHARVIGVEYEYNVEDGIVTKEVRKGYLYHDKILRVAEVIVNKRR